MARKEEPSPRMEDVFVIDGVEFVFPAQPFCDCINPVWKGATKRGDGVWVRPCCMRPTKQSYEKRLSSRKQEQ
jgi:hypothetical protein